MERDYKLDAALEIVKKEANREYAENMALIGKKPLSGWSQEKHDEYHQVQAQRAEIAATWCFVRQLQINLD